MTLPKFTLTGTVETLTGDTLTPLATEVELTPNFPWNSFLSTDDADALLLIHPVDVVTDDAGHFSPPDSRCFRSASVSCAVAVTVVPPATGVHATT